MEKIKKEYLLKKEAEIKNTEKLEAKLNEVREEQDRLKIEEIKIMTEINKVKSLSWVDELIKPLAEELAKKFNKSYDIYGPFGLRAATTIYLMDDKEKSITEQPVLSLTLIPGDLNVGKLLYETGKTKNEYMKGSIGYINGMNNVEKILPDSIEDIAKLVK